MLLEHEAPLLDDVEQSLFEGSRVDAEPRVEDLIVGEVRHFVVNLLVRIDLFDERNKSKKIIVKQLLKVVF